MYFLPFDSRVIINMTGGEYQMASLKFKTYTFMEDDADVCEYEVFLGIPNVCGHCQTSSVQLPAALISNVEKTFYDDYDGYAFTICNKCHATTQHFLKVLDKDFDEFQVVKSIPSLESSAIFDDSIKTISKDFIEIYEQSMKAEEQQLDKIAGMGYRKATEFLVSDYLKWLNLDGVENDWIDNPRTSLSSKIDKIPDERTRKISKAISYLGNDQTHYSMRHPEYDIKSMKSFINALIHEISRELAYLEVEELISK